MASAGSCAGSGARRRRPAAACKAALLLAAAALLLQARLTSAEVKDEGPVELELPADQNAKGEPAGTPTKVEIAGRDVYYEVPQSPKGLVVFFHGCSHNAYDHWYQQEACEECRGLPGEVSHTKQALARGYAFATLNSANRSDVPNGKCFSYADDKDAAIEILRELRKDLDLKDLPLYTGGVSSGASFALKLINELKKGEVDGVFSEVLAVDPEKDPDFDWGRWPPVAFVRMSRDTPTNDRISRNQAAFEEAGVPAQVIEVPIRPVYPAFFSDQAADLPQDLSEETVAALKEIGVLDAAGNILDDPRKGFKNLPVDWRTQLRQRLPVYDDGIGPVTSLEKDASHVSELLNTAWSSHEIVGDYMTAILAWFESEGEDDLSALAEQLVVRKPAQLTFTRLQPGETPPTAGDAPVTSGGEVLLDGAAASGAPAPEPVEAAAEAAAEAPAPAEARR